MKMIISNYNYQKLFDLNDEMDVLLYTKEHLKHQKISHKSIEVWIRAICNTLKVLTDCNKSADTNSMDVEAIEFIETTSNIIESIYAEFEYKIDETRLPLTFHRYFYVLYTSTSLQTLVEELQLVVTMDICINPLMSLYVRSIDRFSSIISGEPPKLKALSNC